VGGSERDQWLLARALAAAGWSTVVGVREHLKLAERTCIDGVNYVGIGESQILSVWRKFFSAERPDWLHWKCASHLWGPLVEIAKHFGCKTIFHAACDLDVRPRHALSHRSQWWPLYAWGLARTDRIFVQHAGQFAGLSPYLQAKAHILPKVCTPELDCDFPLMKSHYAREKQIAWVGTLIQLKRPDVLIEIALRAPDVSFVVCGGLRPGCDEKIIDTLRSTPNVQYFGQVAPEKAQQIIADASLLLSTSDIEGFPNTFAQAWLAGTPVISLKVDPGNVITENNLGVLAGNVERAVAEIKMLIDSPDRRQEIGIRARKHVAKNYSAKAVVKSFEDALLNHLRAD